MKLTHFALAGLFLLLAAGIYLTLQSDMEGRINKQKDDFDRQKALLEREKVEREKQFADLRRELTQQRIAPAADEAAAKIEGAAKSATAKAVGKIKGATSDPVVQKALANVQTNIAGADSDPAPGVINPGEALSSDPVTNRIFKEEQDLLNAAAGAGAERIDIEDGKITGDLPEGEKLTKVQELIMAQPSIAKVKDANPAANEGFVILDHGSNVNLATGDSFAVRRGTAIIGRVVIGQTVNLTECVAEVLPDKLVAGMVIQKGDELIKYDR